MFWIEWSEWPYRYKFGFSIVEFSLFSPNKCGDTIECLAPSTANQACLCWLYVSITYTPGQTPASRSSNKLHQIFGNFFLALLLLQFLLMFCSFFCRISHRPAMEKHLHNRDRVGVQDFVLLEKFHSEEAFIDNMKKRFTENIIYVSTYHTRGTQRTKGLKWSQIPEVTGGRAWTESKKGK